MKKKILVVDDEWPVLELMRIKLTKNDYDVVTARNATEFREQALSQKPDLIILDIWLGDQERGTTLYERILREGFDSNVPVIFISALVDQGTPPRHAPKGGKFALYGKPFDFELVLKEISTLLNQDFDGKVNTFDPTKFPELN